MFLFVYIGIQPKLPLTGLVLYCFYDWTSKTKSFIMPFTILRTKNKQLLDNVLVKQYSIRTESTVFSTS